MLEGQKSLQKRINLEFGLLLLILLSTTARKEMTDLSKKSLFIIFVKENCISTLGQKSINHPKKMQFGNVNFHRIHIVKISLFFKTKFAFFKVSWLTKFTNTEPFFYKLQTPKKIWFWTFFFVWNFSWKDILSSNI